MSETDQLLAQLGAMEREYDQTFPQRWEDVVRGEATVEEVMAEREGEDDPEELAALAEMIRPLRDDEREAWVERLRPHLGPGGSAAEDGGGGDDGGAEAEPTEPAEGAEVVRLDQRRSTLTWWTTGLAAVAAAVLLLVLPTFSGKQPPPESLGSSLPAFSLQVRNETVSELRSDTKASDGVARYRSRSRLHWVIGPERTVTEPLGVRVLVEAGAGAEAAVPRRLSTVPGAEISDRGVIEVRGTMAEVFGLAPGRWSLRFVVGEPAALPADLAAYDRGGAFTVTEPYELLILP